MYEYLIAPFVDYAFMTRALAGAIFLAISSGPLGVFLILRRMSLMADSMSHAILPGAAIGYLIAGLSLTAMFIGGLVTGLIVALLAGVVSRITTLKEDASFASFYLISLGLGVFLVSVRGSSMDLLHVLFGTILGLDDTSLAQIMLSSSVCILVLAAIYRSLMVECLDSDFLRTEGGRGSYTHLIFLVLLVLNLVAGFQVLGTLMVVGMMMLPAACARFMARTVTKQIYWSISIAIISVYIGLVLSYAFSFPTSPTIILIAGGFYVLALLFGTYGGLLRRK